MNKYYVLERVKVTKDTLIWHSDELPPATIAVLVFKKGACKCTEQNYNQQGVVGSDSKEMFGYNRKIYCTYTCIYCQTEYDATPPSGHINDYFTMANRRLEWVLSAMVDIDKLDPVYCLVNRSSGKTGYTGTFGLDNWNKLKYYYPGKEYVEAPAENLNYPFTS